MKNLTKKLFAAAMTVAVVTSSAFTSFATEPAASEIASPSLSNINRIRVNGNVKIVLTQGDKQSVVAEDNYDPAKTSVMSNGQTLFINSKESGLVTLNITLKDLQRVEAYGPSVVVTSNNFDVKYLQIFLHENTYAKIKTTAGSLYSIIKNDAVLKLNGTADQSTLVASRLKNVKLGNFASLKSEFYATEAIMNADRTAMTK